MDKVDVGREAKEERAFHKEDIWYVSIYIFSYEHGTGMNNTIIYESERDTPPMKLACTGYHIFSVTFTCNFWYNNYTRFFIFPFAIL